MPALAVKVALEEFNGIVTLAGTARAATLELNPTTTAPFVAAALRLTVHVVVPPEDRELAAHPREVRVPGGATRMLPPVAEMGMGYAAPDAPKVLLTPIDIELAPGASATVTSAMPPSGIVFALGPVARQMYELAPPAQLMLLPEDVSAELGDTEKPVTLPKG